MKALIVIDMLNDFYTGVLANKEHAEKIVGKLQALLQHAREREDWVVVYANDAHLPQDGEIRVWGEHAMAGTYGAAVIKELAPIGGPLEIVSPKRFYGAFDGTGLDEQLKVLGVDEVVMTGQHTHCCVRHSSYGAFIRDYKVTVPVDATCVFAGVDQQAALEYLQGMYGARLTTTDDVLAEAEVAV